MLVNEPGSSTLQPVDTQTELSRFRLGLYEYSQIYVNQKHLELAPNKYDSTQTTNWDVPTTSVPLPSAQLLFATLLLTLPNCMVTNSNYAMLVLKEVLSFCLSVRPSIHLWLYSPLLVLGRFSVSLSYCDVCVVFICLLPSNTSQYTQSVGLG
jgi:hypothetical protein